MKEIDSKLFVKLMQVSGESKELWFADDCVVSEKGIKSTLPSSSFADDVDDRQTRGLLAKNERAVIDEITEALEFTFPCNYREFREWVVRNDFNSVLNEADTLFYEQYADEGDKRLHFLADERKDEESFEATDESREIERVELLLGKVNIHKLMGSSISKISDDCGLNGLGEYERCFHLYDWKRLLEKEGRQIACGKSTTDSDARAVSADEKIAEIQALLDGEVLDVVEQGDVEQVGRRDAQIGKILDVIKRLAFDPLDIPKGGKEKIKDECLKSAKIFTDSGFNRAWTKGNKMEVIRVHDKEKYL